MFVEMVGVEPTSEMRTQELLHAQPLFHSFASAAPSGRTTEAIAVAESVGGTRR